MTNVQNTPATQEGNKALKHIPANWTTSLEIGFWFGFPEGDDIDNEDAPMKFYSGNYAEYMDFMADENISLWSDCGSVEDDLFEVCKEQPFFATEKEVADFVAANYGVEVA